MVCPINWLHPLNRDLLSHHLYVPGLVGGNQFVDLCRKAPATLQTGIKWDGGSHDSNPGSVRFPGSLYADTPAETATTYQFNNRTFTVSAWFKTSGVTQYFVSKGGLGSGGSLGGWVVGLSTGQLIVITKAAAGQNASLRQSVATYNDNRWHHVIAVITTDAVAATAQNTDIYADGKLEQGALTTVLSLYSNTTDRLAFGARGVPSGPANHYTGSLDDVRIYNRGLTASEAKSLYDTSRRGYPDELNWISKPSSFDLESVPGGFKPYWMRQRTRIIGGGVA